MSLAHLENARSMHLENESLEMRASRVFQKGVDFSTRNGSRNRTEWECSSNANERTEIGEPLFLSFSRSHAECRASFSYSLQQNLLAVASFYAFYASSSSSSDVCVF